MQGQALPARGVCGSGNAPGRIWNPPLRVGVGVLDDPRKLPLPQSSCGRAMLAPDCTPVCLRPGASSTIFIIYYFLFII